MHTAVRRFGGRVTQVMLTFPRVMTAFRNEETGDVVIKAATAVADIRPNGGSMPPYPRGMPFVRIYFPRLTDESLIPWTGGLHWIGRKPSTTSGPGMTLLRELVEAVLMRGESQVGIPCLWRNGEWHPDRDLIFVARQVHRLLTDPGDYSPTDSMNPEAAIYWAAHKDALPTEPPIPELYGRKEDKGADQGPTIRFAEEQ